MGIDYKAMGNRINSIRKKQRKTLADVAEACCISISFFNHIERGTRKASVETLTHISDTLNVPLDFLVKGEMGELYRVFPNPHKKLTDRQKRAFQEMIDMLCVLIEEWTLR